MGRRRVPERDSDFDLYIKNTSGVLESGSPIGSVRLGLSNNEKIQWLAYRDEWKLLYPQYADMNTRTKTITMEKNKVKEKFAAFAARPLGKIALSNNITAGDRAVFKVPVRKATRTPKAPIHGEVPDGHLHSMGSGWVKVRVRPESTEGRPRLHKSADALEMKYTFVPVENTSVMAEVVPNDCPYQFISKTALFTIDVGYSNIGKRMLAFFRWVNFTNPSHNSGWCEVVNVVVG